MLKPILIHELIECVDFLSEKSTRRDALKRRVVMFMDPRLAKSTKKIFPQINP
jgi:hypothetical protein